MDWKAMDTAPRDGRWILLEGEFGGGDTSSVIMARWEPRKFSTGVYEWRTLMPSTPIYIGDNFEDAARPNWNWYCDGRVHGWMPIPDARPNKPG